LEKFFSIGFLEIRTQELEFC